jgi:TolB-like protein/DNA-binding winged helix-turn-helix (wHTH) protein
MAKNQIYTFDGFRLDPLRRLLFGPDGQPIALKPKVFDTLLCLVDHAGTVLSKTELMEAVWGNRVVEENSLSKHISTLRHVLDEAPGEHRFIVTEPGYGYRFVATVRTQARIQTDGDAAPGELTSLLHAPTEAATGWRKWGYPLAGVVCAALLAGVWWDGSTDVASADTETIAVLAFADLSPGSKNELLAEGITIDLTTRLAKAPSLRVTAPNAALSLRDSDLSYAEIGETLGVEYLLDGTVRMLDDQMRVTASLVEASSGVQIWSYPAEIRPLSAVFAIQKEITAGVAERLGSTLAEVPAHYVTSKEEVWKAYIQAGSINRVRSLNGSAHARDLLEQAVRDDPNYLPARYELLTTFQNLPYTGLLSPAESERLFRRETATAVSIWPDDPKLYGSRAWISLAFDRNFEAAARYLELALAGAPEDLDILATALVFAVQSNRQNDAIAIGNYTVAVDPLCYYCQSNLLRAYFVTERYEDAKRVYQNARSLGLDQFELRLRYINTLLSNGEPAAALQELAATELPSELEGTEVAAVLDLNLLMLSAMIMSALGRDTEFNEEFAELKSRDHPLAVLGVGDVYNFVGELDMAIDLYMTLPSELIPIRFLDGRRGDALRDHPRWIEIAEKVGIWPEDPRDKIEFEFNLPAAAKSR